MQGIVQAVRSCQETVRNAMVGQMARRDGILSRFGFVSSLARVHHEGLENITVANVLMMKGDDKTGSWMSCHTEDTVYDAMAENKIGSLVVLKPGEKQLIAGIITERDYLKKIIGQGRSSKYTRVGEIMTDEKRLITVSCDTKILHAMQLMTDHNIRHVQVIDGKIMGMVSIFDVVRAVVELQSGELRRLNNFIKGEYY